MLAKGSNCLTKGTHDNRHLAPRMSSKMIGVLLLSLAENIQVDKVKINALLAQDDGGDGGEAANVSVEFDGHFGWASETF